MFAFNRRKKASGRPLPILFAASVLIVGAFTLSGMARADDYGGGGSDHSDDWNGDHTGIYQVQRGDLICSSREACGGAAAIPMSRPGYFYLPGGILAQHPATGGKSDKLN